MNYQITNFCNIIKNIIHPDEVCYLEGEVDWTYMVQVAKEHNLLPIFLEGAIKQYSYISRPEYEKEMGEALAVVASQVKRTNAFMKLYDAFVHAELYPVVMKGLICRELYGDLCDHRPSGDEDILIRVSEYWKAKDVLITNGYVPEMEVVSEEQLKTLQEVSFIHPKDRLHIELHLNVMGRENDAHSRMSDYFKDVFEDYRETEMYGVNVRTMNHQNHLLFLVLHAFKHFTGGGFGIRQMLDILIYQEKHGTEIDLEGLNKTLHEFRADVFWSDMVHIGNKCFGFNLPILREPKCTDELLEDMIQSGAFGNRTQAEVTAARTTMIATGNYLKNKSSNSLVMIWNSIFPNRDYLLFCAPYLEEKPWLLPIAWMRRWVRFFKKSMRNKGFLASESLKISQRRMKLLKKYDLV